MKRYDKYKDSGVEWIGEIPSHWETTSLKHLLLGIQDGTHGTYKRLDSSPYLLLSAKNVFEDGLHLSDNESAISEDDYNQIISNGYPQKGDIAICCVGTIGRCCIYKETQPYAFQRSVTFLRNNNKNSETKYILYLLRSQVAYSQYAVLAKTTAQSGLYMGALSSLDVTCPPVDEQQSIANYLDAKCGKIDKVIAVQEKRVELLRELKQSIITRAVTRGIPSTSSGQAQAKMKDSGVEWIGEIPEHWEVKKTKYLFQNLDYLRKAITADQRSKENPLYDYYGASGIIDIIDFYNVDDTVLLIGEDGANLVFRNLPLIYKASGKFWVNNHAHVLKPLCGVDYDYMFYTMECADYSTYITGSAQPKLSQENLSQVQYPLPPLAEQQQIVTYIEQQTSRLDSSIAKALRQIELLKEYKQSLITEVVTGKRRVC